MSMKVNHSFFLPRSAYVELFDKTSYRNSVNKIQLNTNKILQKNWTKAEEQLKWKTKSIVVVCFSWVGDVYISATFTIIYWNSPNIDFRSRLPGFSDCSLKSLQKVNDACLYNVPTYKVTIRNQRKGRGGIFWMIINTKIIDLLRSSFIKRVTFEELFKKAL